MGPPKPPFLGVFYKNWVSLRVIGGGGVRGVNISICTYIFIYIIFICLTYLKCFTSLYVLGNTYIYVLHTYMINKKNRRKNRKNGPEKIGVKNFLNWNSFQTRFLRGLKMTLFTRPRGSKIAFRAEKRLNVLKRGGSMGNKG